MSHSPLLTVTTGYANESQARFARDALRSQRQRLAELFRGFDDETWAARTLCPEWNVHEVVRHLCDVTLRFHALVRGEPPEQAGTEGLDPRTTPAAWLARSATERPSDTIGVFERASGELLDDVERLTEGGGSDRCVMPYGEVPWSIVVLHVFWDAWVHERDILVPQGRSQDSPEVESRAAAAFGLFVSGLPSKLLGTTIDEVVVLNGTGGGVFALGVRDDTITVTISADADGKAADALRGDLPDVVDSLIGRGPTPSEALHGPAERAERLGGMRRFMRTPAV